MNFGSISEGSDVDVFQWKSVPSMKYRAVVGYNTSLYWAFELLNSATYICDMTVKHNETVIFSIINNQNHQRIKGVQFTYTDSSLEMVIDSVKWQDSGSYQLIVQLNVSLTMLETLSDVTSLNLYEGM